MMSREQNDQLSRIGPGALMGKLLRRYWAPFLLAAEIPEPDCPPVRLNWSFCSRDIMATFPRTLLCFRGNAGWPL